MKIVDGVYTYDINRKKCEQLTKKLLHEKKVRQLYLIVLPFSGTIVESGLFEIYAYSQLQQKFYRQFWDEIVVVGMAKRKEDAAQLVLEIVQDMYDCMGENLDANQFFLQKTGK
ncbi:MAG: hypothetical protein ACI4EK_07475 [Wujia sp.]